ncbi:3-oxoacyl-[acyl-carrier protein] reductase [Cyclobacterium lianum]|uniref:3-oxoacyl-[acyl-carrier protein] reductase n=1 Tax=Cyclobacterium lianum TaxID=388280 RepID=A0A1M7P923_9BACT|nr:SDR family oxidoreductase [Cyclobacterium lianum]SHN13166.1 3-oxoacyl-[acyl-carrier protein] reductase [Cyclobacterium lianum]
MIIDLTGYQAVVGGATRGLGLAIARQLAESGASVTLMARNEEKLKAAKNSLSVAKGQTHQYLEVDFLNFNDFKERTNRYFKGKKIDILINNTNGPRAGTAEQMSLNAYQEAFDLLFKTYHHLTHLLLDGMKERGYGRILNVASVSVKEPMPNLVLSNSIRSAVVSWAKSLSAAMAPHGITVNSILTGAFDTERIRELIDNQVQKTGDSQDALIAARKAAIPAGRFGKPEEYGYLLAFLASPQAAYINGASIPIDGGAGSSL